jgi:hypothetical protein
MPLFHFNSRIGDVILLLKARFFPTSRPRGRADVFGARSSGRSRKFGDTPPDIIQVTDSEETRLPSFC